MPGKLIETALFKEVFPAKQVTTTGTLYNADGTTGSGIDSRDYDEIVMQVNVGPVVAGTTLDISVVEADNDNADGAVAVTGAAFTQIANANQNTQRLLSIQCSGTKRYLWAKVVKGGTADAASYGIGAVLSKADKTPVTQSPVPDADIDFVNG
jgi:hypothetical protein